MINNSFGAILLISVVSVVLILIFSLLKTNLPFLNSSLKNNNRLVKNLYVSEIILGVIVISIFAGYLYQRSTIMFATLFLILVIIVFFIGIFFFKDYIAGLILKSTADFTENDIVVIDKYEGKIIKLTKRSVVLLNSDGDKIFIPYSKIISSVKSIKGAKDTINTKSFILKSENNNNSDKLLKQITDFTNALPWVSHTISPDVAIVNVENNVLEIKVTVYSLDTKYLQKIENSIREMFED